MALVARAPVARSLTARVHFPPQEDSVECRSPRGSASREPARTTSRTSRSTFPTTGSPWSPGVSGSGKSSLAFDTLFAEGQWRYIESLSTYARMFLERARSARRRPHRAHPARHRARAEEPGAHGALHRRHRHRGLRLPPPALREDRPRPLPGLRGGGAERLGGRRSPTRCCASIRARARSSASPCPPPAAGPRRAVAASLVRRGFARVQIGDARASTSPTPAAGPPRCRRRATASGSASCSTAWCSDPRPRRRLTESLETALARGRGPRRRWRSSAAARHRGEPRFRCPACGTALTRPQPLLFSFNHPLGACPECKGFGNILTYDEALVVPDRTPEPRRRRRRAVDASLRAAGTRASCSRRRKKRGVDSSRP